MKRKITVLALGAMLFALCGSAAAQQAGKVLRIGFLDGGIASSRAGLLDAFRQEMNKLGWIEGKSIIIEYRFADQKSERLPELAAELVRLRVDVIVVGGLPGGFSCEESDYNDSYRNDDSWGSRGHRFGCQSGAAGRQRHGVLEFSDRAKYQKAGGT